MESSPEQQLPTDVLRKRAEEALRGQPVDLASLHPKDLEYLLHELQVHQVELHMQNDELRRAQLELELSRDRYSDLYHFAPVGYCTLNRKGKILEANQTLANLLGIPVERLIDNRFSRFVEAEDQDIVYLHCRRAFQGQKHRENDIHMRKGSGEIIVVRLESRRIPTDKNRLNVALSDVTERKRVEMALAETQSRLHIILENAPLDLYTTDRELRYTWTFGSLYGLPPEAVLGKRDEQLIPPPNLLEISAFKRQVLEDGVGRRGEVHFLLGTELKVHDMAIEPLRGKGGEVVGLTVAAMDITERKRAEAAAIENAAIRQVQHRLLDQRERERQQIAHDLHDGPVQELTGITFSLRGLLMKMESSADGNPTEVIKEMEGIQLSLQDMIHELRTYAGDLRPPTLAKFGLEQAIRSHAETFQEKNPELHITLQLRQRGTILPENVGLALFRIYQQALVNTLKHAQASDVVVRMESDAHQVHLEIQDTGRGFDLPEDWNNLAQQGHLGLLGMRERAEAVDGKLDVITAPGKGTHLIVTVPLESSAALDCSSIK